MNRTLVAMLAVAPLVAAPPAAAKEKPKPSVRYAKTWDAAVEEAKLLNAPIVVHSHGFYCGPCWGMHASVLQSKDYIEFSDRYTVEVISLGRLQEGIDREDRRASTYEGKDGTEYLVEFPNLTIEEMLALNSSPASRYNDTGKIPFTAVVDPHSLKELHRWSGGTSASKIIEVVKEKAKELREQHGAGIDRRALTRFEEAVGEARAEVGEGEFAKGMRLVEKAAAKSDEWPEPLQKRVEDVRAEIVAAAAARLDALEAEAEEDPRAALRELTRLRSKVRGLELDDRIAALMDRVKSS